MTTEEAVLSRPATTGTVFKLKHKNTEETAVKPEEVFDTKRAPSVASVASRPQSSASTLRFGTYSKSSFFSRHNPHPVRVRHIRGLNGVPICTVNDDGYVPASPRFSLADLPHHQQRLLLEHHRRALGINSSLFPIDVVTGLQSYPLRERALPRFGLIPITDTWRDELRDFCSKAGLIGDQPPPPPAVLPPIKPPSRQQQRKTVYSSNTGRLIPPPSRQSSRMSVRSRQAPVQQSLPALNHISVYPDSETLMLNMLCQILQTESIHDVQQWLVSAGEREKATVLDMIRSGIGADPATLAADQPPSSPHDGAAELRLSTAASRRSLASAASGVLDADGRRSALQSRASSSRSVVRPLGTVPKKEVTILEEDESEEENDVVE